MLEDSMREVVATAIPDNLCFYARSAASLEFAGKPS